MKNLNHRDLSHALELIDQFHACHSPDQLRIKVVDGIKALIGADRCSFEHFAPTVPKLWAIESGGAEYEMWALKEFGNYAHEHPAIAHYQETGDQTALKISDFADARSWHRTDIYQRIHRVLGIEDQMGISLGPPNREIFSVVIARGRRSFSERDRALLNFLRPHILRAHQNARDFDRLNRTVQEQGEIARWLSQTAISLDRTGQVLHCPKVARQWLREAFNYSFRNNQLPVELAAWARRFLAYRKNKNDVLRSLLSPFILEKRGRRFIFRFHAEPAADRFAIVIELQSVPSVSAARLLGLTRRQLEVLLEVEKGKTNDEIASALFISPQTVRTHLENIFSILKVTNRTAGVARLRESL